MKNTIQKVSVLLTLLIVLQSYATCQETEKLDSVTVYIGNQVEVLFEVKDFDLLRDSISVLKSLKDFEEHINFLINSKGMLDPNESDLLTLHSENRLTTKVVPSQTIFLRNEDSIIVNTGIRDNAIIHSKNCKITITAVDFSQLNTLSFQEAFYNLLPQLPEKSRTFHTVFYKYEDEKVSSLASKNRQGMAENLLELGIGTGAGLIKSQWVGDFSVRLGLTLNNRGKLWHKFYTSANFIYDFSNQNKANINTFLNVGYETLYYSDKLTLSMEAGYLISRQGNTFDKNTFRLGLNGLSLSSITVSPQVYFPGKLKGAYPSIRVGFGF